MNKAALLLLVVVMPFLAACSKTEPEVKAVPAVQVEAEAKPVDYQAICGHLVPLAPESRRVAFTQSCVANYQSLLPACRNAAAVNDCFSKLKSWDGRLACMDSCVRNPESAK